MRTFQKIAQRDEQELLAKLLPMRILRAKQKTFWTINTNDVTYELVAIGRVPRDLSVTEEWSNPSELDAQMLAKNDIFECYDKVNEVGKYKIVTKCFTGGTEKFNLINVNWNHILDLGKLNCVDIERLGVTNQVVSKKKTHVTTTETIKSITVRLHYKFHFL